MCLLTFSVVGEGFTMRILSFHFSFFESPLGSFQARFCVSLRLSGATRGPLCLTQALLVPILCAKRPQRCLKSESCWTLRTLTKRAPACTEPTLRPFPGALKQDRKRDMSKTQPKLHLPRSRSALLVPRGASGVLQRAHQEAEWAPETPQSSIVASWLCPSVLEPTLWMVSLRNARPALKLHSASQRVPRGRRVQPREPKRDPRGACLGPPRRSIVAPRPPQTVPKSRFLRSPRACEKWSCPPNGGNSILTFICYTSGTSAPPKSNDFGSLWDPQIDAKIRSRNQRPKKSPTTSQQRQT